MLTTSNIHFWKAEEFPNLTYHYSFFQVTTCTSRLPVDWWTTQPDSYHPCITRHTRMAVVSRSGNVTQRLEHRKYKSNLLGKILDRFTESRLKTESRFKRTFLFSQRSCFEYPLPAFRFADRKRVWKWIKIATRVHPSERVFINERWWIITRYPRKITRFDG